MSFTPINDVIVVSRESEEVKQGSIIVETVKKKVFPAKGTVVAASKEVKDVETGDRIMYDAVVGEEVEIDGQKCDLVLIHSVIGKFE